MNREDLELLLKRRPFAPFRLTLSTNESFDVRHPELVMLRDRFLTVAKPMRDGDNSSILIYWISFQHIAHCHRLS